MDTDKHRFRPRRRGGAESNTRYNNRSKSGPFPASPSFPTFTGTLPFLYRFSFLAVVKSAKVLADGHHSGLVLAGSALFITLCSLYIAAPGDGRAPFRRGSTIRFGSCQRTIAIPCARKLSICRGLFRTRGFSIQFSKLFHRPNPPANRCE
jgi:hypothetical protein